MSVIKVAYALEFTKMMMIYFRNFISKTGLGLMASKTGL